MTTTLHLGESYWAPQKQGRRVVMLKPGFAKVEYNRAGSVTRVLTCFTLSNQCETGVQPYHAPESDHSGLGQNVRLW